MTEPGTIHEDLASAKKIIYDNCELKFAELKPEKESAAYGACTFTLNEFSIKFRIAKTTPTKTGQFVTIWKRNKSGSIEPFHILDSLDFIIISTRSGDHFGQFVFPKFVLLQQGIISGNGKEGKRGIRVYPPWDKPTNKQAVQTQQWQAKYFLEMTSENTTNLIHAKRLFKTY